MWSGTGYCIKFVPGDISFSRSFPIVLNKPIRTFGIYISRWSKYTFIYLTLNWWLTRHSTQIAIFQSQREARETTSNNHLELRELLLQLLTNPMETQNIVDMQSAGEPAAERIMEAGQMVSPAFLLPARWSWHTFCRNFVVFVNVLIPLQLWSLRPRGPHHLCLCLKTVNLISNTNEAWWIFTM